jgi:glycosyltransferase involved in cell wall biosynthesis
LAARPGKWLLYVGSELPRKNLVTVLSALAKVKESHSDVWLLKVGSPGLEHFRTQTEAAVKRLGLEGSVLFMGRVPDEDLPLFYGASDLLVHPSKLEGFGFPVLEAMACGTPVVCSNSASLPEIAGDAAIFFDPTRPDEMATAIRRVLEDKALRVTMRAKGIGQAATFTWQNTAERMLELYEKLCHELVRVEQGVGEKVFWF